MIVEYDELSNSTTIVSRQARRVFAATVAASRVEVQPAPDSGRPTATIGPLTYILADETTLMIFGPKP